MTNYDVVRKLIGKISPVGESNEDADRFKNLEELTLMIENLITDIDDMAFYHKDAHQFSIKKSVKFAIEFLNRISSVEKIQT